MNDKESAIRAFTLFNKKADELLNSTFVKKIFEEQNGVVLSVSYQTGEEVSNFERNGPDQENIKAFILDFRYFIINNEQSSFGNLAKHYDRALISDSLKDRFINTRDALNNFLNSPSESFPVEYNGEILTRRKIMNTFIDGGLSHSNNDEKVELFEKWRSIPPFFPIIESAFVSILASILDVIVFTKKLNKEALTELKTF